MKLILSSLFYLPSCLPFYLPAPPAIVQCCPHVLGPCQLILLESVSREGVKNNLDKNDKYVTELLIIMTSRIAVFQFV